MIFLLGIVSVLSSVRFPRAMLNGEANERLLGMFDVEIVDDCDRDLEQAAREWLAGVDTRDKRNSPAVSAVVRALNRIDNERAA